MGHNQNKIHMSTFDYSLPVVEVLRYFVVQYKVTGSVFNKISTSLKMHKWPQNWFISSTNVTT